MTEASSSNTSSVRQSGPPQARLEKEAEVDESGEDQAQSLGVDNGSFVPSPPQLRDLPSFVEDIIQRKGSTNERKIIRKVHSELEEMSQKRESFQDKLGPLRKVSPPVIVVPRLYSPSPNSPRRNANEFSVDYFDPGRYHGRRRPSQDLIIPDITVQHQARGIPSPRRGSHDTAAARILNQRRGSQDQILSLNGTFSLPEIRNISDDGLELPTISYNLAASTSGLTAASSFDDLSVSVNSFDLSDCVVQGVCHTHNENLWPRGEVKDEEVDLYIAVLEEHIQSGKIKLVQEELHYVAKISYPTRLEAICKWLKQRKIHLYSGAMLGKNGDTALHVAVIHCNRESARILIRHGGRRLVTKRYQDVSYRGTTALHLATVQEREDIIDDLLNCLDTYQRHKLLHTEARGVFLGGSFNQNGLPLTIAVCMGNTEVFSCLVERGADIDAPHGKTGGSTLHALVHYSLCEPLVACDMYRFILTCPAVKKWWQTKLECSSGQDCSCQEDAKLRRHLLTQKDLNKETPFTLAVKLGATDLATLIMQTSDVYRFPQWNCGPTCLSLYDVSEIETVTKQNNYPVALEHLVYSLDDQALSFISQEPIQTLMRKKWKYYRIWFYAWAIFHAILMGLYTSFSLADTSSFGEPGERTNLYFAKSASNMFIRVACILYLLGELYDVIEFLCTLGVLLHKRPRNRYKDIPIASLVRSDKFRIILVLFSVFVLIGHTLEFMGNTYSTVMLAAGAIFGWTFLLFFTRAFENIGIFTVMLQRILMGDLVYFTVVFLIILCGFATALQILYKAALVDTGAPNMTDTVINLFRFMVGLVEMEVAHFTPFPSMVNLSIVGFILLANVQLLNMLVASMNATFSAVSDQRTNLWIKMRAKSMLLIERRIPPCFRPIDYLQRKEGNALEGLDPAWLLTVEEVNHRFKCL